jgi:protein KRI1
LGQWKKGLEGDYDPDQFEKAMQSAYGDEFYEKQDSEWRSDVDVRNSLQAGEDVDGVVGQDDVDGGMYDNYDEGNDEEDNESNQEAEEDNEEYVGGEEPEESHLEKKIKTKLQEELYKLDYEDIVAGMPTRFKYRQVEANDYGLTTQEILLARDTTLKQFVSLKKLAPYDVSGEHHVNSRKRRKFREMLKHDLEEEMGAEEALPEESEEQDGLTEEDGQGKKKRRRLKKGKKKSKDPEEEVKEEQDALESSTKAEGAVLETDNTKKRRRKKTNEEVVDTSADHPVNENSDPSHDQSSSGSKTTKESPPQADHDKDASKPEKAKRKKKKSKKVVASLPKSRLASYGL